MVYKRFLRFLLNCLLQKYLLLYPRPPTPVQKNPQVSLEIKNVLLIFWPPTVHCNVLQVVFLRVPSTNSALPYMFCLSQTLIWLHASFKCVCRSVTVSQRRIVSENTALYVHSYLITQAARSPAGHARPSLLEKRFWLLSALRCFTIHWVNFPLVSAHDTKSWRSNGWSRFESALRCVSLHSHFLYPLHFICQ